jgi:DNA-binding NarL/FixJ family response regulator
MHNVVIADSQELFISGVEQLVNNRLDLSLVEICLNQAELELALEQNEVDLLLIDISKSDFDLKVIKDRFNPKVIVFSYDYNTLSYYTNDILEVTKIGINAFITKDCGSKEINEAISVVLQKDKFFCKKILNIVIEKGMQCNECDPVKLSERETEIVKLTVKGLTSKEVGEQLFISYHTVNTHRKKIMKKLGFKSASELVVYAINTGLMEPSG